MSTLNQALKRSARLKYIGVAVVAFAVLLGVAGRLFAGTSWRDSSDSGAAPSLKAEPAQEAEPTRLVPSKRALTPGELTAFRHVVSDVADDSIPIAHGRTQFDGETWSLTTWRNGANEVCSGVDVPGEGHERSCTAEDQLFVDWPIRLARGAREKTNGWHSVWLEGLASPSVQAIQVVTADCKRLPIEIDADGAFFHLISGAAAAASKWPIRVEAHDARGAVVYSARVLVTSPDPGAPFVADQPSCP
jgi:hypothetical protein